MLTAPLLLEGDPGQEQGGGPLGLWHAASPWHRLGAGNLPVRDGSQEP